MTNPMDAKRHELYADIRAHISSVLAQHHIPADAADQAAVAVVNHLAEHWGGSTFSFPKDVAYIISKRDLDIWHKFRGNNHRTLALEYGLSENAIYKIVKRMQQQAISAQQPDMFAGDDGDDE